MPPRRRPFARVVAGRLFDLDDPRAEIAEDLSGEGRGDAMPEFDDGNPRERRLGLHAHLACDDEG